MKIDVIFGYLSKWDKDTFIFGMIAALTICALAAKSPPVPTIFAGALFTVLYIILRYSLLRIQLAERETEAKRLPAQKARKIITKNASKDEQIELEQMSKSATTNRKKK